MNDAEALVRRLEYLLGFCAISMIILMISLLLPSSSEGRSYEIGMFMAFFIMFLFIAPKPSFEWKNIPYHIHELLYQNYLLSNELSLRKGLSQSVKSGYVYLLQDIDVTHYYKIGKTNKPENRINHFDTMLPFEIRVVHVISSKNCDALEAMLHHQYADKHVRGEWFSLSNEDVEWITRMEHV